MLIGDNNDIYNADGMKILMTSYVH